MGLVSPFRKLTCPYCFERFHPWQAPSRSISPHGPAEPDERLGDFLGVDPPEMRRVEPVPDTGLVDRICRQFWVQDHPAANRKKVCPSCHMFLPHKTANGELASEIVALVGARNAGKSNYFGVLLNSLEVRYAREVAFSLFAQETFSVREMKPISSRTLYQARYGARLFGSAQPMALEQTLSAATNPDVRIPLLYRMQFPKRPWQYFTRPFARLQAVDLVVLDAAGEDLHDPILLQLFYRYVSAAAAIIFLVDPFGFPAVQELLPSDLRDRVVKRIGDPLEVVSGVINLFEQQGGLRADKRVSVPVAFALTKTDLLKDIVDGGSAILRDSYHPGGFDIDDCQQVSEEVAEYLRQWGCTGFVKLVEDKFAHHMFFAVSSLGELPDQDLRLRAISPRRIADPLLWLFWKRGYIPRR